MSTNPMVSWFDRELDAMHRIANNQKGFEEVSVLLEAAIFKLQSYEPGYWDALNTVERRLMPPD